MISVEVGKDGIEKALKKFKRKVDKVKILKIIKGKREYVKPSVKRRNEIGKAIYVQKKFGNNE